MQIAGLAIKRPSSAGPSCHTLSSTILYHLRCAPAGAVDIPYPKMVRRSYCEIEALIDLPGSLAVTTVGAVVWDLVKVNSISVAL